MENLPKKLSVIIVKKVSFPAILLLLVIGSHVFYTVNIAPIISVQIHQNFKRVTLTLVIILVVFFIQRSIDAILAWYRSSGTDKFFISLDKTLIPFLRKTVKIVVWIVAILIILPIYGINITALITLFGVASLAISLAAQDTIANIIAGFLIMADRPFRIGDKIALPSGEKAEVLDVGIRRSKFLSEDNAIIIVPNLDLSKSKIINYTYGKELKK